MNESASAEKNSRNESSGGGKSACSRTEPEIRVELYGLLRRRTGRAVIPLRADTLGAACRQLEQRFPQLCGVCLKEGRLLAGYLASINGRTFTTNPSSPLQAGDVLLLLSSDAGG